MMRIAENYARVKTLDLPMGLHRGLLGIFSEEGTYTISFTYVVHSGAVKGGFLLYTMKYVSIIPPSEGRASFTFVLDASNLGTNMEEELLLYSDYGYHSAIQNHVTFHNIHIARGTQIPDIWTPAHADLTPEQIATLPPYGEFKEIKSF